MFKMCISFRAIAFLVISIHFVTSYSILGIFPHIGESHFYVFRPLMKALALKGHNVTVISYFPLNESISNYRDVVLEFVGTTLDEFNKKVVSNDYATLKNHLERMVRLDHFDSDSRILKYGFLYKLSLLSELLCDENFKSKVFRDFLNENNHFDVVVSEEFDTDCFRGINNIIANVPIVGISSCTMMPWTSHRYGNPNNPAYIPNNFLPFSDKMTFFERVENTIINTLHQFYYYQFMVKKDENLIKKHFGTSTNLEKLIYNTSLLLVNSHFTLNLPRPFVPGIIEIGGIHISNANSLPKKLKKFIDESEHGVVYFSFGSLMQSHTMSQEKLEAFLKAFSRLRQRVLWKWEDETMPGKPDNVMTEKWMPQFDILSHPNVKAFISHGGLLGTMEAVHCGVPIIVIPQFGDQHTNAKALEANGGGVILKYSEVTEDTLYKALKKVLSPSFQNQAKDLSERFRDRPLSPMDTAIYWVEYVARHRGALHLRTAAVGMPWYQYYLIDVIIFILSIFGLFFYICYASVRFLMKIFQRKKIDKVKAS